MGEIWSQLKSGIYSGLPRMAGQTMKYISSPGNSVYETGKGLTEDAAAIATLPEMQPGDTTGRPVVEALSKGAAMIPQSIAPAVGAGLLLTGVGAPAGAALIGGSALAAAPAGLAQAQDTYEKGLAKHGLTPEQAATMTDDPRVQEATRAARMTGGIEFGGELAGSALAGRFLGIGGSMAKSAIGRMVNRGEQTAAQTALKSFTNPGAIGKFAGNAMETAIGETATEMGQGAGEAAVEQHYGYDRQTPWDAAKEAVTPTLGMSALLLPFGIPAHASHAVKMNAITHMMENPAIAPETRSQAAEIIYNEIAKNSPDAAANFAAHSFDAIHNEETTGSAPYGLALDDTVLQPLTPRALQEQQSEPTGPLSRAVSAGGQAVTMNAPQPGLGHGATNLLNESAPAIATDNQPLQSAGVNPLDLQPVDHLAAPVIPEPAAAMAYNGHETAAPAASQAPVFPETPAIQATATAAPTAFNSSLQAPVIPAARLHGVLQRFIGMGQEKTSQSGQDSHVWDKPDRRFLGKAVSDYLRPAAEQGLVARDTTGAYIVNTDRGALRITPPTEEKGNFQVEYHSGLLNSQQPAAAIEYSGHETAVPTTFNSSSQAPTISHQAVAAAFPGQAITPRQDGYSVALKNGKTLNITHAKELFLDPESFESGYGYQPNESHKAIASFSVPGQRALVTLENGETKNIASHGDTAFDMELAGSAYGSPVVSHTLLDRQAVITLTEQGVGEIHHEAFHAAMYMALDEKQRDIIIKKFGNEEAAATEYQRLRDSGAFTQPRRHHMLLQVIHNFFSKIRTMLDQTHGIMSDVASGKVWESSTAEQAPATPVKYSLATIEAKTHAVKERLAEVTNKSTFYRQDIAPAMQATGEGLAAAWDGIKAAVNPMSRSTAAEETGRILIEGMGHLESGKEKFVNELNKAAAQSVVATTRLAKALDLMQTSTTLADKLFARMPEASRIDFMQRMDTGQPQRTTGLQQVADAIKTMFDDKATAVQALGTGALETVRDNYFPHAWDRSDDARKEINSRLSKRPLEGSKGFSKARVFEDINAGIEAGFKLVDSNPINLVFLKMAEMDRYLNCHVALQAMEQSDLVELIPAGEKMPDGFGDISGKYGLVTKRAHQDNASGEPGELKSYRYIAREDVAQVFNNYLSQNLYSNKYVGKPFSAYMKAANVLNQFQLGVFSAFHAGFTSMEAVISHAALGIKALTRGDLQKAGEYFKHAPAAWYLNPKLGDKVIKAWMGDEASAKEMPQIVQWLEMAGARRIMDSRFQTDQTQKMFQAWSEGNKIGAAVRSIPAIVEQSARPILEWLVPRQKFGVFAEMANDWSQRNPNAGHEATRKAMQQIWNRVDSRLGQVVYDRLFVHNVAKNLTQAIIRAPGWTGGTILEVGGGFKDLVSYGKDIATKGKQAELSDRAAYTLSLLVTTAIANAILTAAFTGEPPEDWKDLLAFRTGGKDEKGNPERFMLPTYMKDVYAYAQQPGTTLMHKAHPLLSLIGDLAHNKDYYGTEIRHQGDNPIFQLMQAGKFTAKAFIPFWIKGAAKEMERSGSIASMAAPLIGVMPAPADLNKTAAERLASQLVADRMPQGSKTEAEFERSQLIQHLSGLARRDKAQAHQEVREALKDKKITMLQARHVFQNARLAPIMVAFKRLSFEEAERVYEVASDEEKKKLRLMLAHKRHLHQKAA
jgi:hypothetical protein